ncbi:hypothetical protein ACJIZ3_003242 [Penstemon smallii]|uniref:Uncharacterized protein n=1 Tax=Penstemon smallii TaxID=265156 RepID=A0ABD3U8N9_9LAMI
MAEALARKIHMCLFSKNFSSPSSLICKSKTHVSVSLFFSTSVEKQKPPPFVSGTTPCTVSEFLMHRHHFSLESASRVASAITHLKNPHESDSMLSFLKEIGLSNTQLEKLLKNRPSCLNTNLENIIKPKIKTFQDIGFSADDIAHIISFNPAVLHTSLENRIIPSLSVLKGLLGSGVEVAKVLRISSWLLLVDLEKNLVPNIELLKSCGIPMKQIIRHIYLYPRMFLHKPETMRKFVDKADEMGVDRNSRMFVHAVRVVSSMSDEVLGLKFKAFRDLGFPEDDILRVFRYAPKLFDVSVKKIKKVKEVLLETGKYDVSCILNNPISLMYSVEKRYKPRLQVLGVLEKRNLIKKWPALLRLAQLTNNKFHEKFVAPFSNELRDVKLAQKDATILSK